MSHQPSELKIINDWPTFPQIVVQGELIGGLDIVKEMYVTLVIATLIADVYGRIRIENGEFQELMS